MQHDGDDSELNAQTLVWKYEFSPHLAHNLFPLVSSDFYEKSLKQKVSSGAIMSCTNLIPYYHKLSATHA